MNRADRILLAVAVVIAATAGVVATTDHSSRPAIRPAHVRRAPVPMPRPSTRPDLRVV